MAQIPSTPRPTTTTTSSREAAKARAHAPSGKTAPSTPRKTAPATPGKKVDDGPLPGARKAAKEGADEIRKAVDAQPTPERKAIVRGYKTGEAVVTTAIAGAKEIGEKVKDIAKPIHEPFTREIREAGTEISKAGSKYGKDWVDSLNPLDEQDVRKAWDDAPTIERKILFAGWEGVKNVGSDAWNNTKNFGNLGREVLEGAGEIWLHNPGNNAVREAGKGALELGKRGVEAGKDAAQTVGGWISDRISGGAEGAEKASRTASDTQETIRRRSELQRSENAREVREAAGSFGDNYDFNEIGEAWNDAPTIERQILFSGWKAAENLVQGNVESLADAGNVVREAGEATVESLTTGADNLKDGVVGGANAVGDFVGGLFG